jgi:glycosyltransferase involved in cell wall biosynthesis
MIKVSIIVPIYKTEQYLQKCLLSLLNQTIKEIEIIAVIDGSPDNSYSIVSNLRDQHPEVIQLLQKTNGGLGDARNYALPYVKGDYIGFVDSDDYVHPQMYEMLYARAVSEDADISICEFSFVDEVGKILNITNVCNNKDISMGDKRYALKYGRNEAFNKIYKKELFLYTSIRYPKIWFEDYPTTPLLISQANKIAYVNNPLYYYVQRKGSIMNQAFTFSDRNFEILNATEIIVNAKEQFEPEHFRFYLDEVVPVHAFIRFYKNIISIENKNNRINTIKKWGSELNRLLPGWEKSSAIGNLRNKIRNPLKKLIFGIIIQAFKTGDVRLLNMLLSIPGLKQTLNPSPR